MWKSFKMHSLLPLDWDIKGKRQHGRMSDRMTDRQPATSPQHKLHWALFPLRRISGELCVGWLRLGHTAQDGQSDCLATVALLGERTWLRGCSWFEMVSGLNPGGHQTRQNWFSEALFFRFLQAVELGGCGKTEQVQAFHLDCEQLSGFPLNYREWLHPT